MAAAHGLLGGCAQSARHAAAQQPAVPIDLSPRCLEIPGAPPAGSGVASRARPGPGAPVAWPAAGEGAAGLSGWSLATPHAAHDAVLVGFHAVPGTSSRSDRELAATLLRTGATTASPQQFRRRLRAIGARAAVHVEQQWLWLELQFPPQQQAAALEALRDWLHVHPPGADAFARARRTTRLATLAQDANAAQVAERAFARRVARPEEPPPAPAAAGPEALDAWLRATLQPQHAAVLHTSAAATASAGAGPGSGASADAPALAASRRLRSTLAALVRQWPNPAPPVQAARAQAEPAAAAPLTRPAASREALPIDVVDRPGSPQVEILVGFATVGPRHRDAPALEMLASLLGADVGGRLFRDLRERQGLAYIIDAHQQPEGRFVVSTRARPERVAALLVGIEAHLGALATLPLAACERAMLVERLSGEAVLWRDDPGALREGLRRDLQTLGAPRPVQARIARVRGVSKARLEDTARRYLGAAPVVVLVGDARGLRRSLARELPERSVRIVEAVAPR